MSDDVAMASQLHVTFQIRRIPKFPHFAFFLFIGKYVRCISNFDDIDLYLFDDEEDFLSNFLLTFFQYACLVFEYPHVRLGVNSGSSCKVRFINNKSLLYQKFLFIIFKFIK